MTARTAAPATGYTSVCGSSVPTGVPPRGTSKVAKVRCESCGPVPSRSPCR